MHFAGIPMYKWRRLKCAGSHNCGIIKQKIFVCLFVPLQSVFIPLSALHFPVAWWHSGDISRTGLLLFVVSFNPPVGSCRFLRTSTFLTRKLWGGRWKEVNIASQILPSYDIEMGIYSWKVNDLTRKMKGFINSSVKIIIARKLG